MKKIILNKMKSLLRKITVLSFVFLYLLCCLSCATQNCAEIPQDPIIGKWQLISTSSGRDIAPGNITQPYSTVTANVIFEFKPDNILTIQRSQQNDYRGPWKSGNYLYWFNRYDETTIRIDHTDWRCRISENQLMIGRAHVGETNYYFERVVTLLNK